MFIKNSDLNNIATEDLVKELSSRKQMEVPKLIDEINNGIQTLRALGFVIKYKYDADYELRFLQYNESNEEIEFFD